MSSNGVIVTRVRVRTYEYVGGGSAKFWRVAYVDMRAVAVCNWGKIGTNGQANFTEEHVAYKREGEKEAKGYDKTDETVVTLKVEDVERYCDNDDPKALASLIRRAMDGTYQVDVTADSGPTSSPVDDEGKLSQRTLKVMELAAVKPEAALVEYALVAGQIDEQRDELKLAEAHLRTLEVMLGIDERETA